MKKIIYVSFEVNANSYQEAERKFDQQLNNLDNIISDDEEIRNIIKSRKFVNKVKI